MSEELQSGDAAAEVQTEAPAEDQTTGAELATASESEGQHEDQAQVDEAAAKQAAIDKVIGEKHFQAKQAERERDELQAKLNKIEDDRRAAEAASIGQIPAIPDPLDDDFETKLAARDDAIKRQVQHEANTAAYNQTVENQRLAAQQQENVRIEQEFTKYSARAVELGIDSTEMNDSINRVMDRGISQDIVQFLRSDPDGPLFIKHLDGNVNDVIALSNMEPVQRGAFLEGLRRKAEALKPRTSNTPKPVDSLSGNGVQADTNRFPMSAGAEFS